MKSRKYCMIIMMMMIATVTIGCSKKKVVKHTYTYEGENSNWVGVLKAKGSKIYSKQNKTEKYDTEQTLEFSLTYKGDVDDIKSLEVLKYKFEYSGRGGSGKIRKPDKKVIKYESSATGGKLMNQEEEITVTVECDDRIETFVIRSAE